MANGLKASSFNCVGKSAYWSLMPQWISPQTLLPQTCLPFLSCKTPGTNLDQDRCEQLPICSMDASRMVCFVLPSIGKLKVNWYIERHRIIPYLFYWFLLFTDVLLMTQDWLHKRDNAPSYVSFVCADLSSFFEYLPCYCHCFTFSHFGGWLFANVCEA